VIQLALTSDPYRTFITTLGEARYRVTQQWNERAQTWTLDLEDGDAETVVARAMPLVLGADILRSYAPQVGTMLVIDTAAEPGAGTEAGPDDLGARVQVIWIAPGEVIE